MKVEIMQATPNPLDLISLAAGCCYGKDDISHKRAKRCIRQGHTSVAEHAVITFKVEGISRACLAQLTRHRIGVSFSVMSQRYCKIDVDSNDWYVKPESFGDWFDEKMHNDGLAYLDALDADVKAEDARFLLPEATKTNLFITMNARALIHFLKLRSDPAAQWEIRELANEMRMEASVFNQWRELINCGLANCED